MLRVLACIREEHAVGLVTMAIVLAFLAATSGSALVRRARASTGAARRSWLIAAACATGLGVWATHFVGMLAYRPGLPFDLNWPVMMAAAAAGVLGSAGAYWVWLYRPVTQGYRAVGAVVLGLSFSALHYIGMAGLVVAARKIWAIDLVLTATALSIGFAMLGAWLGRTRQAPPRRENLVLAFSMACFAMSIISLHFVAMGALTLVPDPRIGGPVATLNTAWLPSLIGLAAITLAGAGYAASITDSSISRIRSNAMRRMAQMADATFEGIAIHDGRRVIDANARLCSLTAASREALIGLELSTLFPDLEAAHLHAAQGAPAEAKLLSDAGLIDVEVQTRLLSDSEGTWITAVRDIRERKERDARIAFLRDHDALTGLPGRPLFVDALNFALVTSQARGEKFAVLNIGVRGMTELNEQAGQTGGDRLLAAIGERLREASGRGRMACRLAGNEFAVLLTGADGADAARALAERLRAVVCAPVEIGGRTIAPVVSSGLAFFPTDGRDADELLACAAFAQKRGRSEGGDMIGFYDPSLNARSKARRSLERDLREAIEAGEITPYYQPQALTQTGLVQGFEALARWPRSDGTVVAPSEFIPIAEETGLIEPLGALVLDKALRDAARWPDYFRIGVNLSARQVARVDVPEMVSRALATHNIAPGRLEIEITETMVIEDFARARKMMEDLKAIGVKLALDDFGAGYCSLAYLNAMPVDRIKIDRAFIADIDHDAGKLRILRAILELSRAFGMETLAEGVEREEELAALKRERCDFVQGFLVARPMPAGQVFRFLEAHLSTMAVRMTGADARRQAAAG